MSTNKVYGDLPNTIPLAELPARWDYSDPAFAHGVPETLSVDQSTHSLFGASKLAADVLVQEYGRYFGMPTCCLRAGCVTGPNHAGVELHGFLSYLVKCNIESREYRVFGYKAKQVRDNIHAEDVAAFAYAFWQAPRIGEVYNLGGGKANACSILEAFALVESITHRPQVHTYIDEARRGDHICYYSDLRKIRSHYPAWDITKSLADTVREIVGTWSARSLA
jgi:CDP-paratose 2-epimerase